MLFLTRILLQLTETGKSRTGIRDYRYRYFDNNEYFDITIEYAKADIHDILVKITVENKGPKEAPLSMVSEYGAGATTITNLNFR